MKYCLTFETIVYLLQIDSKHTIIMKKKKPVIPKKGEEVNEPGFIYEVSESKRVVSSRDLSIYSPVWVVDNPKDAPAHRVHMIEKIRTGVKKNEWKDLLGHIKATEKEFEEILPGSISSMQKKNVYDRETSERIYEISDLFGLGYEVFDSKENFKNWLTTPSRALGNKRPFDLLDSSFGFEIVKNEIVRIQYNVYS